MSRALLLIPGIPGIPRGPLSHTNPLSALLHEQNLNRRKDDPQILKNAGVGNIHQIHLEFVIGLRIALAVHLRVTCKPSLGLQAKCKLGHLFRIALRFRAAQVAARPDSYPRIIC